MLTGKFRLDQRGQGEGARSVDIQKDGGLLLKNEFLVTNIHLDPEQVSELIRVLTEEPPKPNAIIYAYGAVYEAEGVTLPDDDERPYGRYACKRYRVLRGSHGTSGDKWVTGGSWPVENVDGYIELRSE